MSAADRSMALGLRALRRLAGTELVDRVGLRKPLERAIYRASRNGFRAVASAGRAFRATRRLSAPVRQTPVAGGAGLFDLTPSDEQQMLMDAFGAFAAERLRPVAQDADSACATPAELLRQANELGAPLLGVPEELGGVMAERSAVTSVLVAEQLAHGDAGIAAAILAPTAVATAISLWGDAGQQARYLEAFTGDDVPAAALALLEPHALSDPFALRTKARRSGGGFVLSGEKSLVARARDAELFLVGAELDGACALFIVEPGADGLYSEPQPAMGVRAAATGKLVLEDVALSAERLLGGGEHAVYAECVARARLAWCAIAIGTAQAVADHVIPYVNERHAFGEPVSHRQAVAFMVADIATELEGMRLTTLRAAALADAGKPFARPTAIAHRLCSEKGMTIGSNGVQLLGGHGYVKEHPVERWYRDLRAAGTLEGGLLV